MTSELNETFMVRTETPEMAIDEPESTPIEKIKNKLTQVQLKATSSNEDTSHVQAQRSPLPAMDLHVLPKAQADVEVITSLASLLRLLCDALVSKCHRFERGRLSFYH